MGYSLNPNILNPRIPSTLNPEAQRYPKAVISALQFNAAASQKFTKTSTTSAPRPVMRKIDRKATPALPWVEGTVYGSSFRVQGLGFRV